MGLALTTCTVMLAVSNVNILYDLHMQWLDLAQEDGLSDQSMAQFIRERGGVGLMEESGGTSSSSLVDSKSIIDSSGNSNSGMNNGEPEQTYPDNDNENDTTSAPAPAPTPLDLWDQLDVLSGGRDAKNLECPPPLVLFQNKIVKPDQDLGQNTTASASSASAPAKSSPPDLIPKIINFSMRSRCIPQDLARNLDRWKEVLPNYSIFFHDDDAVDRLMDQDWLEFPNYHDAMKCILTKGAMKIDVWRVLLLYKYGGVYSDIDNWPLEAFKETMIRTDLSAFFFSDAWTRPSQWFMAAEPRHPIMHGSMHHIIQNLLNMQSLWSPKVVFITGPNAVKDGYYDFLASHCCNGTVTQDEMLKNDVVMTGMLQKQVMKISPKKFITSKYGYNDLVAWNSTLNMTREERIQWESGVIPWAKANFKSKAKVQDAGVPRSMTC